MITITIEVFNRFGEVESRATYRGKTYAAAASAATRGMGSWWGREYVKTLNIIKRKSTACDYMYFWEVR